LLCDSRHGIAGTDAVGKLTKSKVKSIARKQINKTASGLSSPAL
jgi:hypothetical protein